MTNFTNSLSISASGMNAQAMRLRLVSENIANADTPGYRRKLTSFESVDGPTAFVDDVNGSVTTGPVTLDQTELARTYDPGNPLAGKDGYFDGSNVDLVTEMADAREAQRSYEANLKLFDQARQMSQGLLDLLKR